MDLSIAKMKILQDCYCRLAEIREKGGNSPHKLSENAVYFGEYLQIKSKDRYCGKARQ